jgi:hypothetical protein
MKQQMFQFFLSKHKILTKWTVYGIYSLHPRNIDEDVDIESVCSDMSEAMSQVSIDTERQLSPSDFKQLLVELKGSEKPIEKCREYTDDLKSCQEFIDLRKNFVKRKMPSLPNKRQR